MELELWKCPNPKCGKNIPDKYEVCPFCKTPKPKAKPKPPPKKSIFKSAWFWVAILVLVIIGCVGKIVNPDDMQTGTKTSPRPSASEAPSEPPSAQQNEANGYRLKFGAILDANPEGGVDGKTLIIKAKINSQASSELTIAQNYHNIEDLVKNQGATDFECIDYWAVADMSDGSESKVMAFTVSKEIIEKVANGSLVAIQLQEHVDDLYIHPSLVPDKAANQNKKTQNTSNGNSENFDKYDNPEQQETTQRYALNTSSMIFHYPSCDDVRKIKTENYDTSDKTSEELESEGYRACGHCKP